MDCKIKARTELPAKDDRSPALKTFSSWSTTSASSALPTADARLNFLQNPATTCRECLQQHLFASYQGTSNSRSQTNMADQKPEKLQGS